MKTASKKVLAVVIATVMVLSLIASVGCSSSSPVDLVKSGHPLDYPDKTYGDVFGSYFGSPKWTSFTTDDNETVVEFTGKGTYYGEPGTIRVQFTIDKGGKTFTTTYFAFEDSPITFEEFTAFMEDAFN